MRKIIIVGLISTLPIISTYANENQQNSFLKTFSDNAFFKDSKIDFTTRNHWKYLKENAAQSKIVHSAWGQAFGLEYKSGYLYDIIGFDVTYNYVVKLGASDYFATRNLLYNDGKGFNKHNAKGFKKFTQRYAKIKLGDEHLNFHGKVGWHSLKDFGVISSSQHLTRYSYLGYSGALTYDKFSFVLGQINSTLPRESSKKVHILSKDGKKKVDNITTAGIAYKDKSIKLDYSYGIAKDYLRRHVIETTYKPIPKLTLNGFFYGSYALDNYDTMRKDKKEFENHAWHSYADIEWKESDWSLRFGVAYTDANKHNAIGYYGRHLGKNTRGRFNAFTAVGSDYTRDGELALVGVATYDFVQGSTSGVFLNYGQFNYKDNTLKNGEITLFNIWKPTDSALKNLSVLAKFGYGWSYKTVSTSDITPKLRHGRYQRSPNLTAETVIDYRFNLL